MHPTLATLMVAADARESGDEPTRRELLDGLIDAEHVGFLGYGTSDGEWESPRSWISCAWCTGRYYGAFGNKQATDCASSVWQRDGAWFAVGHYGSRSHDMTLYRFVQNEPREAADPVCDACLNVRLASGDLIIEREDVL
jgi:hypothetical protein